MEFASYGHDCPVVFVRMPLRKQGHIKPWEHGELRAITDFTGDKVFETLPIRDLNRFLSSPLAFPK